MTEETKVIDYATLTEDQLKQAMKAAFEDNDWTLVKKLSAVLTDKAKSEEKAKREALVAVLVEKTQGIKALLTTIINMHTSGEKASNEAVQAIQKQLRGLSGTELDGAEGVWFAYDFGEKLETGINPATRLVKTGRKASTGEGGGSSKGSYVANPAKSADLINEVGSHVYIKEATTATIDHKEVTLNAGMTFKEAFEFSTNGGLRNRVRMALLKEAGRI